ncbi:MAG: MgtC/SapB family protein [Luteimonas sp.]
MSVISQIGAAVARELALPDVDTGTTIVVRVLVAAILGGMVGWERERKRRAAGLKTHILVSIGSALFVLAPLLSGIDGGDVTRVMQGIVSGIGFLGAGAILKLDKGERIEGLTTAAGVWMTAAIGMAAGMGQEVVALATTVMALLVVSALPKLHRSNPASPRDMHPDE